VALSWSFEKVDEQPTEYPFLFVGLFVYRFALKVEKDFYSCVTPATRVSEKYLVLLD
jgi:hypothetical protein